MITQIRDRERADRFLNDVRSNQKKQRNYGRYIYLTAVVCLFLWLLNLLLGSYLWLRAEGLVVSDHVVVASPYDVQVFDVAVQPGQQVRAGELLARINSPQVSELMATLTARQAELAIRLEVSEALTQTAQERLAETEAQLQRVNLARDGRGFVSDSFLAGIQKDHYAAMTESAWRTAERRVASKQWTQLQQTQEEARVALDKLRSSYNDGVIIASMDGIVGPTVAVAGDVITSGDHLMRLYVGEKYALVYLETGTLYNVGIGDRVEVAGGFTQTTGQIVEVLPLTVPLPSEFQKAFRPPSRGQVARIALDRSDIFPIASKISIVGDKLIPGNDTVTRSSAYAFVSRTAKAASDAIGNGALFAVAMARSALPGVDRDTPDPVTTGTISSR
jgi:multidrug resistance efflux pump